MRKVKVGRGLDCDVVIPDETDNVSRQHLVISFDLLGKMKISDTSSNGTYINGRRMLKGTSMPVTTADDIRLGDRWKLDWAQVQDPYRQTRKLLMFALAILVLVGIGLGIFYVVTRSKEETKQITVQKPVETGGEEWNRDSTMNVAPIETSIKVENVRDGKKDKSVQKKKPTTKGAGASQNIRNKGESSKISSPSDDNGKNTKDIPIVN